MEWSLTGGPHTHGCIAQNPGGVCGGHGRHRPCQHLLLLPIPPLHLPGFSEPSHPPSIKCPLFPLSSQPPWPPPIDS